MKSYYVPVYENIDSKKVAYYQKIYTAKEVDMGCGSKGGKGKGGKKGKPR